MIEKSQEQSPVEIKEKKKFLLYYLAAIGAFLFWGTSFAFGKIVSPNPLSPLSITAFRTLIGTVTLFLIIFFSGKLKEWLLDFKKNLWKYLIMGICVYSLAFLMEYWSLSYTKASNQAILSNTMVIWVVIINFLVFHHKPKKIFLVGMFLAIIGAILIMISEDLTFNGEYILGDIGTLIAYLIWGFYSAFMAKINVNSNSLYATLSTFLWASIFLVPLSLINGSYQEICELSLIQWGATLYLGIICGGIAFWLYNIGLSNKNISSEYIAFFSLLNPIIGVFSGMILLNEVIPPRAIIGILFIISAIFITNKTVDNMDENDSNQKKI
ncbi:MAG: DMT family transporter [Promethearchaeota archaeon]